MGQTATSRGPVVEDSPLSIGVLEKIENTSDEETFQEESPKIEKLHCHNPNPLSMIPSRYLELELSNQPNMLVQPRYNVSSVYEWNIDGTSDRTVAELFIAGFSGQLKGWWDYYLTKIQQLDILNVVQEIPHILKIKTRIFCQTLDVKNLVISNGEKVRNKIRETFGSHIIPYDQLTYGKLISLTQKQGLEICQDLKLQKRLKWELRKSKKELGSFFKKFDFTIGKDQNCDGDCSRGTKSVSKRFRDFRPRSKDKNHNTHHKKHYYKKPYRKSFRKQYDKPKTNKANLKDITCYKCGKKGHISKYCRVSRKIQELHLEGEVLDRIEALLAYSSDSETEMSSEGQNPQFDELVTTFSSGSDSNSDDDSESKHVNVLTKEQNLILDVIQHISNPEMQKKCLDQLKKSLEEEPKTVETNIPSTSTGLYDLTTILDRKRKDKKTFSPNSPMGGN
ncbi:uncharacterized protein LOC126668490 [Mercurialis annua]|uniref:uncharacterized protein LOC126668490 n=1 Tax=Mercurialis annua TaxID=3986 RepID=UPI00215EB7D3|nr:uncharacterized protein LOC126668490 [Mercurialis annua]